jgi:hypothetical protein
MGKSIIEWQHFSGKTTCISNLNLSVQIQASFAEKNSENGFETVFGSRIALE